ncbi:hypothetical protein [Nocardioides insulae]|uniref:hypothetical protein n=1 Tax=Nocardioides insulae TaxID=394734 RepID=UPI0004048B3B|nr:hypothetical protein [Nocardioides insulae]
MSMRAGYVPGGGLLLGDGSRWLLADSPPDPGTAQQLWDALVGPRIPDPEAVADLAAMLGASSVVVIDLDARQAVGVGRVIRGDAGLAERGEAVELVLDRAHDRARELPLASGVVGAASVRITLTRPAPAAIAGGSGGGRESATGGVGAPAAGAGALIDGIPDAILHATAPDLAGTHETVHDTAAHPVLDPEHDPGHDTQRSPRSAPESGATGPQTGPHSGTAHDADRSGEGRVGHTRVRTGPRPAPSAPATSPPTDPPPPVDGPPGAAGIAGSAAPPGSTGPSLPEPSWHPDDHDGHTQARGAEPPTDHLSHATGETVQAVRCDNGHYTPAHSSVCRTCGGPVAEQPPSRVPRPPLGVLGLPDGQQLLLDRGVVLGRKPRPLPDGEAWPHLVRLPDQATHLSRLHVQITLDGWLVLARDLGSRAGTTLLVPGRAPERLRPYDTVILENDHRLLLGDDYTVTFRTGLDLAVPSGPPSPAPGGPPPSGPPLTGPPPGPQPAPPAYGAPTPPPHSKDRHP